MATYVSALGLNGKYAVVKITTAPAYSVYAECDDETRAGHIAALLTADEA